MNNNTIGNITVDELHEYVTIMASKIAKMTVEENSVVTGTITASAGNNYTILLKTSDSLSNARPLTDGAVYNVGDYVYLIRGAAAIEGGESPSYFIFGRVDDTKIALANASDLERFNPKPGGIINWDEDLTLKDKNSHRFTATNSNSDFWTALKNEKALKIEGKFTTADNVGVTVTYNYADGTTEEFKLDSAWMQGLPKNMDSLYQARVIERTKAFSDADTVIVTIENGTNVILTAGTLNKYLKDFSLEVKPTNKSYFFNELPVEEEKDTVRLEARLKYLDGAINSGVQYYWFVEMPEGVSAENLDDVDKDQVNDIIGGDRWYCLNSYNDCNVVGQEGTIRIWNKSDNFIVLDKFKYLHKIDGQDVFSFDSLNQIPLKFINKIKCVAVYEGFYINSEVFELVDYSCELYSVSLKASEVEPHNIVSKEDFVEFECIVTNNNPHSGGLTPTYYWYVVNSQAKNADFNLTFDDTKQYYLYNVESEEYYEKTSEAYDASVIYYKSDSENPGSYLECTPDDFQIRGFKQDKTYFIKTSITTDDGGIYEEFQLVAADAEYDSSMTYYTGSLINPTDNTKNILRVHGGIDNEKMINYKVDNTALYMFYCVVEFISHSVELFTERTSFAKVYSWLDNTLVFTESYKYYISQNSGVTFSSTNDLKENVWTISDNGAAGVWEEIDNKDTIATKFDVFSGKATVNNDGSLARWHLYYTYLLITQTEGSKEVIDKTEWSRPVILRIVEYRNGAWTDIRSSTEVSLLNTFNELTNNGLNEGLYYTDINEYVATSDKEAQKNKAYYLKEAYQLADNSYFKLGFKNGITYYQIINNTFTVVDTSEGWIQGVVYYKENANNDKVKCELTDFNRVDFLNSSIQYWTYTDGEYKLVIDTEEAPREFAPDTEYYVKGVSYRPIVVEEGTSLATKTYYEKTDSKSHLYINATYINTGTLSVGLGANEKFYASIHNPEVRIAGFTVDENSISNNKTGDAKLYFGKEGLYLGEALKTSVQDNKVSVEIDGSVSISGTGASNKPSLAEVANRQLYSAYSSETTKPDIPDWTKANENNEIDSTGKWHKTYNAGTDFWICQKYASSYAGSGWGYVTQLEEIIPYNLSIENDYMVVTTDSNGEVEGNSIVNLEQTAIVSCFKGVELVELNADNQITISGPKREDAYDLKYSDGKATITIKNIEADLEVWTVSYKIGDVAFASSNIKVVKNKSGAQGEAGSTLLLKSSATTVKKIVSENEEGAAGYTYEPTSVTFWLIREKEGEETKVTSGYDFYINDVKETLTNGEISVTLEEDKDISSLTCLVKNSNNLLIDLETITFVSDGERGDPGLSGASVQETYYKYLISTSSTDAPTTGWDTEKNIFEEWTGRTGEHPNYVKTYVWKKLFAKLNDDDNTEVPGNAVLMPEMEAIELAAKWQIVDGRKISKNSSTNEWQFPEIDDNGISILLSDLDDPNATEPIIPEGDIGRWCYLYNRTVISGGAIVTGSITADKLKVNSLEAVSGEMGRLTTGLITSYKIALQDPQSLNIAQNIIGFELPTNTADNNWNPSDIEENFISNKEPVLTTVIGGNYRASYVYIGRLNDFGNYPTQGINTILNVSNQNLYSSLKYLRLADTFITIEEAAFNAASNLEYVWLGTGITTIKAYAFGSTSLKEIILPASLTTLDENAFYLSLLEKIYFNGTKELWSQLISAHSELSIFKTLPIYYQNSAQEYVLYDDSAVSEWKISTSGDNFIESNNFTVSHDGRIDAREGKLGDFELKNNGLESLYVKINSLSVKFPILSYLELGSGAVLLKDEETLTSINTTELKPFIILNNSGAGLKFDIQTGDATATRTLMITVEDLNQDATGRFLNRITWSIQEGSLLIPITIDLYFNVEGDLGGTTYNNLLTLTIPSNLQTQTFELYDYLSGEAYDKATKYVSNSGMIYIGFSSEDQWTGKIGLGDGSLTKVVAHYAENNNMLYSLGHFFPRDETCCLGSDISGKRWGGISLASGAASGSDRRLKYNIDSIITDNRYDLFFDHLIASRYQLYTGTSNRYHIGFIALDVAQSLSMAKITTQEFGGLINSCPSDMSGEYSLRYEEFIALCVDQIQKLKKRVGELETQLIEIKGE